MSFFEVENVSVNYGHITALSDVSIGVEKGKIVSIIGSNGAGKSTLLNTISGVVKRQSGKIRIAGKELSSKPHKVVNAGIIQVPEGRRIFPGLTVTENMIMGGCRIPANEANDLIPEMYSRFPILAERKSQMAGTLSGGEQQMLAIARGLMAKPEILLLDEPSLGLAPIIVSKVFDIIREINERGITVLLVEQNASMAMGVSDYTYVLENGHISYEGPSSALKSDDNIKKLYLGK